MVLTDPGMERDDCADAVGAIRETTVVPATCYGKCNDAVTSASVHDLLLLELKAINRGKDSLPIGCS